MADTNDIVRLASTLPPAASADEDRKSISSSADKHSLASSPAGTEARSDEPTFKSRGVIGVEAMARYAASSKKGRYALYSLAVLIYLLQWVVSTLS